MNVAFLLKRILLLLLIMQSVAGGVGFAQGEREELEAIVEENKRDTAQYHALIGLYQINRHDDLDKATRYLDKAMVLANELSYEGGQAEVFLLYGGYYGASNEFVMAEEMFLKSKALYEKLGDQKGVASSLNNLGNVATFLGNYDLALEYFLEAVPINEKLEDTLELAMVKHNIGGIHYEQGRYDLALKHWEEELELEQAIQDSVGIVYSLNAISGVYTSQDEFEKALEVLHRTLAIAKKISFIPQMSTIYSNMGVQHQHLEQLDSSGYYYKKAIEISKMLGEKYDMAVQYNNIGRLEFDLKNGLASKAYFDSSRVIAEEIEVPQILEYAYDGLADANRLLGNHKEAFDWLEKWHDVQVSLTGEVVQKQLNEVREKYETEQKDKEIAKLQKTEAEATLVADRRKALLFIIITVAVSAVLILLFYLGRRKAREQQRRAELEQKALRSQMNPHFIFNSLGAIQQMYVSGELDLANSYMADFGSLMRKILDNSGRDMVSVKEELEMLKLYVELEKGRSNELLDYKIEVDERIDQRGIKIPPLIIQPFVENAIWHGILPLKKKGMIRVNLKATNQMDHLLCEIEDNGVGMQESYNKNGYESKGMTITEQRLGNKVMIENLSPGTRVIIKINI